MSDYGLLEEVRSVRRGSVLTATASIGDSALVVDYGGDFNNDPDDPDNSGGILDLNGARLTYTSVTYGELPDDPDTILLEAPLAVGADIDDSVLVVTGGQIAEDWVAHITMGEGDQVLVPLSVDQRSQWPLGVYADPVPVIVSDDLLHLEDAPGRTTQLRATIWAEDHTTAAADDADVELTLTFTPTPNTLAVFKNGIRLLSSEFSLDGVLVTVPPSTGVTIREDDSVSAYYEYDGAANELGATTGAAPITFLGFTDSGIDGWTIPTEAVEGCLLIAVGMVSDGKTVTEHGWESAGESSLVTHASAHAPFTYRLCVLWTVWDGSSTVPTVTVGGNQSTCLMAAFSGGTSVEAAFATVADALSASTPAIKPSSLRVWGTIGNLVTIIPSQGTAVGYAGGDDIDIAMTLDPATTPVSASVAGSSGWCLASLVVR